jgi:hypothetical protein
MLFNQTEPLLFEATQSGSGISAGVCGNDSCLKDGLTRHYEHNIQLIRDPIEPVTKPMNRVKSGLVNLGIQFLLAGFRSAPE